MHPVRRKTNRLRTHRSRQQLSPLSRGHLLQKGHGGGGTWLGDWWLDQGVVVGAMRVDLSWFILRVGCTGVTAGLM